MQLVVSWQGANKTTFNFCSVTVPYCMQLDRVDGMGGRHMTLIEKGECVGVVGHELMKIATVGSR